VTTIISETTDLSVFVGPTVMFVRDAECQSGPLGERTATFYGQFTQLAHHDQNRRPRIDAGGTFVLENGKTTSLYVPYGSTITPVPADAGPAPRCTPECDALQGDPTKATGLDRNWHADNCPVAVQHHVTDGVTECGTAVSDLPAAHGFETGSWRMTDCRACLAQAEVA